MGQPISQFWCKQIYGADWSIPGTKYTIAGIVLANATKGNDNNYMKANANKRPNSTFAQCLPGPHIHKSNVEHKQYLCVL